MRIVYFVVVVVVVIVVVVVVKVVVVKVSQKKKFYEKCFAFGNKTFDLNWVSSILSSPSHFLSFFFFLSLSLSLSSCRKRATS